MKMPTQHQVGSFILYAFPAYLPLVLSVVAICVLKTPLTEPFLILLLLFNAAVLLAAVLLVKKHWWISLPMLALGIFIALQNDQHIPLQPFGLYLILHYVAWGLYAYKTRKNLNEPEKNIFFFCGIITVFLLLLFIWKM